MQNSLVIGLMREALVAQTAAYQARQRENLDRLFDGLSASPAPCTLTAAFVI